MTHDAQRIALYEDEIYGEKEAPEPTRNFVIFLLGGEWYGVDMMNVDEVVPCPILTFIPNVPGHIEGIFSLRGNIMSATNLKTVFGLSPDSAQHAEHRTQNDKRRIIVISDDGVSTGLLVDGSEEAIIVPVSKVEPAVSTLAGERGYMIEGQFRQDEKLIAVLSAEKVIEKTRVGREV